jgi:hypothetical protein
VFFGAVIDQAYTDREQRDYEEVLHKFDEMLTRQASALGAIAIHDRRIIDSGSPPDPTLM